MSTDSRWRESMICLTLRRKRHISSSWVKRPTLSASCKRRLTTEMILWSIVLTWHGTLNTYVLSSVSPRCREPTPHLRFEPTYTCTPQVFLVLNTKEALWFHPGLSPKRIKSTEYLVIMPLKRALCTVQSRIQRPLAPNYFSHVISF